MTALVSLGSDDRHKFNAVCRDTGSQGPQRACFNQHSLNVHFTAVFGVRGDLILGAEAEERDSGQIMKGLVCQVEESGLYPVGCWGIAEVFEQAAL